MISKVPSTTKDWVANHQTQIVLIIWGVFASLLLWFATPDGVGVGHDSIFYLDTADNLANGHGVYWTGSGGVRKPLTHFPPIYPLFLAIPIFLGFDQVSAARILASLTVGVNVCLLGYILLRYTRNYIITFLGILTILGSSVILRLQVWAMSEPLFLIWMILSFLFVSRLINTHQRRYLWLSSVSIALAILTRYVGSAVLLACLAGYVLLSDESLRRRTQSAIQMVVIAVSPLGLWLFRNWRLTGSTTNRTFQVHLVDMDSIRQLLDVVFDWFTTIYLSHWIEGGILLLFFAGSLAYLVRGFRKHSSEKSEAYTLPLINLLFIALFLVQLLGSLSFFDASTRIDDRILSPVFVSMWVVLILLFFSTSEHQSRAFLSLVFIVLFIAGPGADNWRNSRDFFRSFHSEGMGFNSNSWRESELIGWIRSQPEAAIIVTNQSAAVRFLTEEEAIQLPESWDPVQERSREDYQAEVEKVRALLREEMAYLVLFSPRDLSQQIDTDFLDGLQQLYQSDEGIVYEWER